MQDWQQRVIIERRELDNRLAKLDNFLTDNAFNRNSKIPDREWHLLLKQHTFMEAYSKVLAERIAAFLKD